jgi:hypothetical protein
MYLQPTKKEKKKKKEEKIELKRHSFLLEEFLLTQFIKMKRASFF